MARSRSKSRWKPILVKREGLALPSWAGYLMGGISALLIAGNVYFGWKKYFSANEFEKKIPAEQVIALLLESGEKEIDPNLPRPKYGVLRDISNYGEHGRAYELLIFPAGVNFHRSITAVDGGDAPMDGQVDHATIDTVVVKPATGLEFREPLPSTLQQKLDIAQQMFDWARVQFPTYIDRWRKEYKHAEEK